MSNTKTTVTTTWRFSSLASIADHLENKASLQRQRAADCPAKSHRRAELIGRATEGESIAYMLRNATIEPSKEQQ